MIVKESGRKKRGTERGRNRERERQRERETERETEEEIERVRKIERYQEVKSPDRACTARFRRLRIPFICGSVHISDSLAVN